MVIADGLGVVSQTLRELSKIISRKHKMSLWWEFQAETLYMCPCFEHMYKVSAWNSQKKYDFYNTQNRQNILENSRLNKKDGLTRYGNSHVKDKTS